MNLLFVSVFLLFIGKCFALPDLFKSPEPATFNSVHNVSVMDLPRDSQDKGVFILAELFLPSKQCDPARKIWSKLTKRTCQSKYYQIYFNGRSIGFTEDGFQNLALPLSAFLEEYKEHLVVQYYEPGWSRYSDSELNSFILNYILEHKRDTLSPRNCRQFAADFSEHFFDARVVNDEKMNHKGGDVVAWVVAAAVAAVAIIF